ncbi:MAG: hypothetical protein B6D72_18640 [gamma proteobacterium symbiont of Ctena orbiculata]|uniref:Cytochrome C oxidase subunit III n=1 Tax=Candidatus Thiodiazotropha taylori TaxID=2792791 RepID=A0A944QX71_9GAMM|nr:hypothetical protein [Candidatus Thiodiazotropha taylori]PUB90009.1 MAG: hypothetical protein DBP00_01005 [gamma proteobacterium symbiont of Ctena orbiculata]MBT2991051.1 hypothetical protein [Candidatus Thiodiazotropha taylori]MBT2996611.1 hypothetical protein [Candidatus Thiodiazotropha taylori]MBT3000651.1 hypothetical protein [Candidatus Thiodiazotropha taylori]
MPRSGGDNYPAEEPPGSAMAIAAESLFLANLLLIPGIAFVILALVYFKQGKSSPPLARSHLDQTFIASLWAGVLLVVVNLVILLLGGYQGAYTWMVVIIYFTVCHSSLILIGMLGLAKAMAGKCYRYPLIGKALPEGCRRLS